MLWKRQRLVIQQHTRIWRYFGTMRMLGKRAPHGKPQPLRTVLHHRLRYRLERWGRSARSVPPGAFRTPWGWRRISQSWAKRVPSENTTYRPPTDNRR